MLSTLLYTLFLAASASASVIHPNGRNDLCVQANRIAVGGGISLRKCNGKRNQQWTLQGYSGTDQYRMLHVVINPEAAREDQLCLQAGGLYPQFNPSNGDRASLVKCPSGWHSARFGSDWLWDSKTARFELTDYNTGLHYCLDNTDGKLEDLNPTQIWECQLDNVNPNQVWSIE